MKVKNSAKRVPLRQSLWLAFFVGGAFLILFGFRNMKAFFVSDDVLDSLSISTSNPPCDQEFQWLRRQYGALHVWNIINDENIEVARAKVDCVLTLMYFSKLSIGELGVIERQANHDSKRSDEYVGPVGSLTMAALQLRRRPKDSQSALLGRQLKDKAATCLSIADPYHSIEDFENRTSNQ